MWDMSKKLITQKIPPGRLIAVQQLYRSGQPVLTLTSYTTFEVNYGAWEIPADYPITSGRIRASFSINLHSPYSLTRMLANAVRI